MLSAIFGASGGGARQVEMAMAVMYGIANGVALALPQGRERNAMADVHALSSREKQKIGAMVEAVAVPHMALVYRNLTTMELESCLAFLKSPVGSKNINVSMAALAGALSVVSAEVGQHFARLLRAPRS